MFGVEWVWRRLLSVRNHWNICFFTLLPAPLIAGEWCHFAVGLAVVRLCNESWYEVAHYSFDLWNVTSVSMPVEWLWGLSECCTTPVQRLVWFKHCFLHLWGVSMLSEVTFLWPNLLEIWHGWMIPNNFGDPKSLASRQYLMLMMARFQRLMVPRGATASTCT